MLRPLNLASPLRLVFGLLALTMATPEAAALSQRTFVASYGSDASPNCALLAPCRSFNAAIAQTSGGGEVVILDTAGYGPMVINKALKVIGPSGVYGGISVIGGAGPTTGIVINAANGDDITLRGLDISGVPGAAGPFPDIGIDIQNAGGVHIEKSTVSNFTQDTSACIKVTAASTVRVYVDDSFLRACRTGIYANGTAPLANRPSVLVDNTRIERGRGTVSYGVWMQGAIDVSLRNSMISRQDVGHPVRQRAQRPGEPPGADRQRNGTQYNGHPGEQHDERVAADLDRRFADRPGGQSHAGIEQRGSAATSGCRSPTRSSPTPASTALRSRIRLPTSTLEWRSSWSVRRSAISAAYH